MSLKERLKKNKLKQIDIVEEKIPLTVQQEVPLEVNTNIKLKLLDELSEKIFQTPDWNKYDEVEQKNLIVKFTEFQLNSVYKNDFSTSMQKQFFTRDILLSVIENNKLDFYLEQDDIISVFICGTKNFVIERKNKKENVDNIFETPAEIKVAVCKLLSTAKEIISEDNIIKAKLKNNDLLFITNVADAFTVTIKKDLTDGAVELFKKENLPDSEHIKFLAGKIEQNKKILLISTTDFMSNLLVKNIVNLLDSNDIMLSTGDFCPSEEKINFHFNSINDYSKIIPANKIFINNIDNQEFLYVLKNLLNSTSGTIVNLRGLSYNSVLEEITLENYLKNVYIDKEFLNNTIEIIFDYIVICSENGFEQILSINKTSNGIDIDEIYANTEDAKSIKKAKTIKAKKK